MIFRSVVLQKLVRGDQFLQIRFFYAESGPLQIGPGGPFLSNIHGIDLTKMVPPASYYLIINIYVFYFVCYYFVFVHTFALAYLHYIVSLLECDFMTTNKVENIYIYY